LRKKNADFKAYTNVFKHLYEVTSKDISLKAILAAASNHDGKVSFYASKNDDTFQDGTVANISKDNPYEDVQEKLEEVDAITLYSFFNAYIKKSNKDFLKVDVESYEEAVFQGAFNLLYSHEVPVIIYECHGTFNKEKLTYPANIEFFETEKYDNWIILENDHLYRIDYPYFSFSKWKESFGRKTNCIAIGKEYNITKNIIPNENDFKSKFLLK